MSRRNRLLSAFLAVMTLFLLVFSEFAATKAEALGVSASSAVLIEAESGKVIYEKNPNVRRGMASTTKIMTALVAIESCDLEMMVKIPKEAVGIEGSSLYLTENEVLTLRELLYALMLRSANDAATAIAIAVGGSVEGFADLMNARADEMGLENTHFVNPHGLDSPEHYTTAYELALIAAEAIKNPLFRQITSTVSQGISLNGVPDRRLVVNHNRLLRSYKGCIGVKTGFTKKCGRCLVSAAERNGVTLVAVTLNAPDDWRDHAIMLDQGFGLYESLELDGSFNGNALIVGGTADTADVFSHGSVTVAVPKDGRNIRRVFEMRRFYYAPINEGDVLGRVVYYEGSNELASFPITAQSSVPKQKVKRGFISWLKALFD